MSLLLLAIGSITIIAAVLGALVQHDLKKLLSFHAVSQVGYMVLGIGTGLPIGVAGGGQKIGAIRGALAGRFLNVLITDEDTALALVK